MTVLTSQRFQPNVAQRKHGVITRAALVIIFWGVAAALVTVVHQRVDATSPVASVAGKVGVIVLIAAAYVRTVSPQSTLDHALLVGTMWVLFNIAAEITVTATSGRQWFALIGSPANGGLRCVLLIAWIIAPALFVRSHT